MSRGMKNIHWFYSVGDNIKTDRQDFILTNKEIRDKIKKSKTSTSGFCHEYQKWYEYTCLTCNTEKLWMQENAIKNNRGCPNCNKIRQKTVAPWKYEVGQRLVDDNRDLTITDRKVVEREQSSNTCVNGIATHLEKYYKYKCNICGYDDGWKVESSLKLGQGCACCKGTVTVPGINDIPTTAPWMVDYFQGGYEEAKLYTRYSGVKLNFKCIDCGKIRTKKIAISTLYTSRSISCECSDKTSYPEKFFSSFLNQLHIPFEREFTFVGYKYRYDFIIYSIKKDRLFIVETDGGLGHGNISWSQDIQESRNLFLRDMDKTILALKYNIPVIRIDCFQSDKDYISNNIINNDELKGYIDIVDIDWDECDKFALKNVVKEICTEFNTINDIDYLSKKYKIHPATIKTYIKKGEKYGWVKIKYKKTKRQIYIAIYKNNELILVHEGLTDLCKNSIKLLGTKLNISNVSATCLGNQKQHKGFVFKYISKAEYDKLLKQFETK
jgi:hypothetical protein